MNERSEDMRNMTSSLISGKESQEVLRLRPYRLADAEKIVTWCADEEAFYKWSAGRLGSYPLTPARFNEAMAARDNTVHYFPFVAEDDQGLVGFFILRQPGEDSRVLRFGFVIVNPELRGRGYGQKLLKLGAHYAFRLYGAKTVCLGVFANNPGALYCYRAVGFRETGNTEEYRYSGESWNCLEMEWKADEYAD